MKNIVLVIFLALLVHTGSAQSCSDFINASNNKKLTYASMDAKGKETGRMTYAYKRKDASTVSIHSEVMDKNGKAIANADYEVTCNGDALKIDMKSMVMANSQKPLGNMQMVGDAKYLVYPLNLKAGQTLDDGSVTMSLDNNGHQMGTIQMDVTNRKVEGTETITTGAGSFECFRISYDSMIRMKMIGIGFPVHMHVKEWFSPKIGRFVKSESFNKNDKEMGSMELQSIN